MKIKCNSTCSAQIFERLQKHLAPTKGANSKILLLAKKSTSAKKRKCSCKMLVDHVVYYVLACIESVIDDLFAAVDNVVNAVLDSAHYRP